MDHTLFRQLQVGASVIYWAPVLLWLAYKFTIQNSITWWHIRVQLKWLPLIQECTNFRYQVVRLTEYCMVVSSICGYSTQYGSCFMSPLYCLEFWGLSYIFKKIYGHLHCQYIHCNIVINSINQVYWKMFTVFRSKKAG